MTSTNVCDAMAVAGGEIPSLDALMAKVQEAERLAASHPGDPTLRAALLSAIRPTPLDPARPALDLLEDLLLAIHGCWLIFSEYADLDEDDDSQRLRWLTASLMTLAPIFHWMAVPPCPVNAVQLSVRSSAQPDLHPNCLIAVPPPHELQRARSRSSREYRRSA